MPPAASSFIVACGVPNHGIRRRASERLNVNGILASSEDPYVLDPTPSALQLNRKCPMPPIAPNPDDKEKAVKNRR